MDTPERPKTAAGAVFIGILRVRGPEVDYFAALFQGDLATAEDAEFRAILDYQLARIEFERTQRASLGGAGIALVGSAMERRPVGSTGGSQSGPFLTPQRLNRGGTATKRPKGERTMRRMQPIAVLVLAFRCPFSRACRRERWNGRLPWNRAAACRSTPRGAPSGGARATPGDTPCRL